MANNQHDIISVIMAAYNSSMYIGDAIQSLIDQECLDWELLIVNDGSTDTTLEVSIIHTMTQSHSMNIFIRLLSFYGK